MRTMTGILSAALILSLILTSVGLASERDSYAERSQWVDVEALQLMIQEQLEAAGPWIEYEAQPFIQEEMDELMEDLAPMLQGIQIEVMDSLREDMLDLSEVLHESLSGIRIDTPRVRVNHYESRQERIEEEIQVLERRLEKLRERLEELDESF